MNWMIYDQILAQREKDDYIIMTEAEKHYRQSVANYEATRRERAAWNSGLEERMKGMEQSERKAIHTRDSLQRVYEETGQAE